MIFHIHQIKFQKTKYNFFRTGRKQTPSQVVGIEAKIGDLSTENETPYFPPSHWSTKNDRDAKTTPNSIRYDDQDEENRRKSGAKAIDSNISFNKNGKCLKLFKRYTKFHTKKFPAKFSIFQTRHEPVNLNLKCERFFHIIPSISTPK